MCREKQEKYNQGGKCGNGFSVDVPDQPYRDLSTPAADDGDCLGDVNKEILHVRGQIVRVSREDELGIFGRLRVVRLGSPSDAAGCASEDILHQVLLVIPGFAVLIPQQDLCFVRAVGDSVQIFPDGSLLMVHKVKLYMQPAVHHPDPGQKDRVRQPDLPAVSRIDHLRVGRDRAGTFLNILFRIDIRPPESSGTFRFVASCKDQLDQVLTFNSNDIVINYVEQTPAPTEPPQVTPPKPAEEPMPTDQPEPEWLGQAETLADGAKWIFAAVAGILLILLLIGAVRRGKSRSESKKAMDHLDGANYRDYSTAPKRGKRSEISNGGTEEEKPAAEAEKAEAKEEVENTVQSSELMAETLRKLYSDKTEEAAEVVTETVEEAAEEAKEAVAETAEAAAETAEEAVEEVKKAAEEAAGTRRRRGRKQE